MNFLGEIPIYFYDQEGLSIEVDNPVIPPVPGQGLVGVSGLRWRVLDVWQNLRSEPGVNSAQLIVEVAPVTGDSDAASHIRRHLLDTENPV